MKSLSKKDLATVTEHNFTKELKDFEYETKFTIKDESRSSLDILKLVRKCFSTDSNFYLCKIDRGDKLLTKVQFFISKNIEYSTFVYRGARMVKIKHHVRIKGKPYTIFKNDEKLVIDKTDFKNKLSDLRHRFRRHNHTLVNIDDYLAKQAKLKPVGTMIKERVKDFVINLEDGRIYAIAVSFCTSNNVIQKQLEIEYSGFLPSYKRSKSNVEKQVIDGVQEVSHYIHKQLAQLLTPTVERKFSFVKHSSQ